MTQSKVPPTLSENAQQAWQEALVELQQTEAPYLGPVRSFCYNNKFEVKLDEFFRALCHDGLDQMTKEQALELLNSLGMEGQLGEESSVRWQLHQVRRSFWEIGNLYREAEKAKEAGDTAKAKDNHESVLKIIDNARTLFPFFDCYMDRGRSLTALGRLQEARELFDEAIEKSASNANLYRYRAKVHEAMGDKDSARSDEETASRVDEENRESES